MKQSRTAPGSSRRVEPDPTHTYGVYLPDEVEEPLSLGQLGLRARALGLGGAEVSRGRRGFIGQVRVTCNGRVLALLKTELQALEREGRTEEIRHAATRGLSAIQAAVARQATFVAQPHHSGVVTGAVTKALSPHSHREPDRPVEVRHGEGG